jgi:16S rRNA (adenine1518-N6/adenine1519-N6)-dimethyltransferase
MTSDAIDFPALIRKHGIRPKKGLGQNFLLNRSSLRAVLMAADLKGDETVLEIGAGIGSLTSMLAGHAAHVVAVEVDPDLISALRVALGHLPNVEIVLGDIMKTDVFTLIGDRDYCVVANIPYNITSSLIRRLVESPYRPSFMVLTLQEEVAQRIVAGPGQMSLLALGVQIYGQAEIMARIPAGSFFPKPKVDSAVIRIDLKTAGEVAAELVDVVFELAHAAFRQKRKQLANSLSAGLGVPKVDIGQWLGKAGISPHSRPQALSIPQWLRLASIYREAQAPGRGR